MQEKQIHLFLINGFLGSGKTTFLLKLLSLFSSQKCGVLMNEFGEIGIDGLLLPQNELELIEINGGSIFCQCRHDTFVEELIQLSTTPIDVLFIEASGLADPVTMDKDLQIVRKKIGEIYAYSGNICLIDSLHFISLVDVVQTIEKQIQYASVAIINKIDLVTPKRVLEIKHKLRSINSRIKIIRTSFGDLSQDKLEKMYSKRKVVEKDFPGTFATTKSAIDISLRANHGLDSQKVREYFSELAKKTRRMKGFIQLDDGQWYYLDSVNGSLSLTQTGSTYSQSMIVVIFKERVEEKIVSRAESLWVLITTREANENTICS
ncbi:MAG: GTP-binding protein [Candidatus Heimdallarchaeota archaeon]|nr:MAG: GTP-binding protein [Candidatus Heimdallarchaeota archaeon]